MTDLTRTQWMWIIGIAVVFALGGLGYYFSTRGQLGMQGVQFQTGFGVGAPAIYKAGSHQKFGTPCTNPDPARGQRSCKDYCFEYWSGREGSVPGYNECIMQNCDKGMTCCETCQKYGYSANSCNVNCTR